MSDIIPYSRRRHRKAFTQLLADHFAQLDNVVPPAYIPNLAEHIANTQTQGEFWVWLGLSNGKPAGFLIAQIDGEGKDWCKRPGWGFCREVYVDPAARGKGLARGLVAQMEQTLFSSGARNVYLTTQAGGFWQALGYSDSGQVDEGNGLRVFTKRLGDST
ncbi:MAG: GNAT family N-acetyltransferase [Oscillospiraceae bacterium]|jgi:GNAT superfamily N-acetyltransferase|nr:GNAT family N-acetyltransferase [Oscillospiraceae bacterium]